MVSQPYEDEMVRLCYTLLHRHELYDAGYGTAIDPSMFLILFQWIIIVAKIIQGATNASS